MIDLRCHLFDGGACGPQDFAESVEMCRRAHGEGVRTLVATERWEAGWDAPPQPGAAREQQLERLRASMGDGPALKHGFVFRFRRDLPLLAERFGASITLGGGRYVLVSLPALSAPPEAEEVWERLSQQRFSSLVAGPECSPYLRRHRERLEGWVERGVCLQLNAASVTGGHGREAQRFALDCARRYPSRVVVASNARDASARRPSLAEARTHLQRHLGKRRVEAIFEETPAAILDANGAETVISKVEPPRKASGLLQLLRLKKPATDAPS